MIGVGRSHLACVDHGRTARNRVGTTLHGNHRRGHQRGRIRRTCRTGQRQWAVDHVDPVLALIGRCSCLNVVEDEQREGARRFRHTGRHVVAMTRTRIDDTQILVALLWRHARAIAVLAENRGSCRNHVGGIDRIGVACELRIQRVAEDRVLRSHHEWHTRATVRRRQRGIRRQAAAGEGDPRTAGITSALRAYRHRGHHATRQMRRRCRLDTVRAIQRAAGRIEGHGRRRDEAITARQHGDRGHACRREDLIRHRDCRRGRIPRTGVGDRDRRDRATGDGRRGRRLDAPDAIDHARRQIEGQHGGRTVIRTTAHDRDRLDDARWMALRHHDRRRRGIPRPCSGHRVAGDCTITDVGRGRRTRTRATSEGDRRCEDVLRTASPQRDAGHTGVIRSRHRRCCAVTRTWIGNIDRPDHGTVQHGRRGRLHTGRTVDRAGRGGNRQHGGHGVVRTTTHDGDLRHDARGATVRKVHRRRRGVARAVVGHGDARHHTIGDVRRCRRTRTAATRKGDGGRGDVVGTAIGHGDAGDARQRERNGRVRRVTSTVVGQTDPGDHTIGHRRRCRSARTAATCEGDRRRRLVARTCIGHGDATDAGGGRQRNGRRRGVATATVVQGDLGDYTIDHRRRCRSTRAAATCEGDRGRRLVA